MPDPPADLGQPPTDARLRLLALISLALTIVARAPNLLLAPRLWVDDATTYLAYAWRHGLVETVLFVPASFATYLHLVANLAAAVAARLPLELAPTITTGVAFAVQLAPFAIALYGRSPLWRTLADRLTTCAVLLLAPAVGHAEVWLNVANSQVFCGLTGVMLLVEDPPHAGPGRWWRRGLLALCVLSGPYTAFLLPAFGLRWWWRRSPEHRAQAAVVAAGTVVQGTVSLWARLAANLGPPRLVTGDWGHRSLELLRHDCLQPLLGVNLTDRLADVAGWLAGGRAAPVPAAAGLVGWIAAAAVAAVVVACWRWSLDVPGRLLVTGFAGALIGVYLLAPVASGRYAVVPGTVLVLALAAHARRRPRSLATVLVVTALSVGAVGYLRDQPAAVSPLGGAPGRPSWRADVAEWRRQPERPLTVWPYTEGYHQSLYLAPRDRDDTAPPTHSTLLAHRLGVAASRSGWRRRVVPLDGIAPDSALIVDLETPSPPEALECRLRALDGAGRQVSRARYPQLPAGEPRRVVLVARRFIPAATGGRDARLLEIAIRSRTGAPVGLRIDAVRQVSHPTGVLEPLLAPWTRPPAPDEVGADRGRGYRLLVSALAPATPHATAAVNLLLLAVVVAAGVVASRTLWLMTLLMVSALAIGWLSPRPDLLTAAALAVAVAAWRRRDGDPGRAGSAIVCGAALGLAMVQALAAVPLAAGVIAALLASRDRRGAAIATTAAASVAATLVAMSGLPAATSAGVPTAGFAAHSATAAWQLMIAGRYSLVRGFPAGLLAIGLVLRQPHRRATDLLLAGLLGALLVTALGGAAAPASVADRPGDLAPFYCVLLVLAGDWRPRWTVVVGVAVFVIAFAAGTADLERTARWHHRPWRDAIAARDATP